MNIAGIDIGGTKCAVIRGETNGKNVKITEKIKFPTPRANMGLPRERRAAALLDELAAHLDMIIDGTVAAVGISCGSPLNSKKGVIEEPPNLPGWDGVPITDFITARYHILSALRNDANACALAEYMWGAGAGCEHMIFLTFGTGMGAGLILGGKLYAGASDDAGEVGHTRMSRALDGFDAVGYGKPNSFEGWCSGGGIARYARFTAKSMLDAGLTPSFCKNAAALDEITARSVGDAADEGHADALGIYGDVGERLGEGLAMIIDVLNPQRIVIGSIYERSGELLRDRMMEALRREALPKSLAACEIVPAVLGDEIGDYAALSIAAEIAGTAFVSNETVVSGVYRHFKGGVYEVLGTARHSETGETLVVYRSVKDGGMWTRPIAMWNETVTHNGAEVRRFTKTEE